MIAALREGPFCAPAHTVLEEVRNSTGYAKTQRYADLLAVSLWPSRGLWFAGVEVKVSRSDWKMELKNPAKSVAIQRYCDYWWLAAPEGVVEPHEVPESWGLYTILPGKPKGGPVRMDKQAPKLTPDPLSTTFVASVIRNFSASAEAVVNFRVQQVHEAHRKELAELPGRVVALERQLETATKEAAALKRAVAEFEQVSGVRIDGYNGTACGERFKVAQTLDSWRLKNAIDALGQTETIAAQIRAALEELGRAAKPAPSEPISLDVPT